jgi:hypothetical protein
MPVALSSNAWAAAPGKAERAANRAARRGVATRNLMLRPVTRDVKQEDIINLNPVQHSLGT